MSGDSLTTQRPRGLPQTILHVCGAFLLTAVGNAIWVPVVLTPVLLVALLSGFANNALLLPALFGIYLGTSMGAVGDLREGLYDDSSSDAIEFPTETAAIKEELANLSVLLVILIAYIWLLFGLTVVVASMTPSPTLVAVAAPLIDRILLDTFERSPASILIEVFAKLVVAFGVVDEVDLSILSRAGLGALV